MVKNIEASIAILNEMTEIHTELMTGAYWAKASNPPEEFPLGMHTGKYEKNDEGIPKFTAECVDRPE